MEHSTLTPVSRGLVIPSPLTPVVALANGNCLEVHCLRTNHQLHSTTTAGMVTSISWGLSKSGRELIAAGSSPDNCVVLIDSETGSVIADIHDSVLPTTNLFLSQRGHLAMVLQHSLGVHFIKSNPLTRTCFVPFVKAPAGRCMKFSPCGNYAAMLTKKDGIDGLTVIHLDSGDVMMTVRGENNFAGIHSVTGIRWVPKAGGLLVYGSLLEPLHKGGFALLALDGSVLYSGKSLFEEHENGAEKRYAETGLGIKTVTVNSDESVAAIGCHDGSLMLINLIEWTLVAIFPHATPEISEHAPPTIFRERTSLVPLDDDVENNRESYEEEEVDSAQEEDPAIELENLPQSNNLVQQQQRQRGLLKRRARRKEPGNEEEDMPYRRSNYFEALTAESDVEITKRLRHVSAANTRTGCVSHAEFSADGMVVATRSEVGGNVVFLWDVKEVRLAHVIILEDDVTSMKWGRNESQLGIVTGGSYVYLWKRSGIAAVHVQADSRWTVPFCARKVSWGCDEDDDLMVVVDGISAKAFLTVYVE